MEFFVIVCVVLMMFVNGATDTPGCIAGAVTSGSLSYGRASAVCAIGNFAGTIIACAVFPQVAKTVTSLANLPEEGVAISLLSAVVFSSVAWFFGIPTSESHGLIASLGGASLYFRGSTGVGFPRIVSFSFLSCVIGAMMGYAAMLCIRKKAGDVKNYAVPLAISAAGTSFCHGMQDGQKFAAILALAVADGKLTRGVTVTSALIIGFGCFFGGKKMINKLGRELTGSFHTAEALASDLAAFLCSVASGLCGVPVSTTYMKTFAMIGSSGADHKKIDTKTLGELIATWLLTYPACMLLSYVLCSVSANFIF